MQRKGERRTQLRPRCGRAPTATRFGLPVFPGANTGLGTVSCPQSLTKPLR
jgi:hypothetical protein